jgi:hypothetical protein
VPLLRRAPWADNFGGAGWAIRLFERRSERESVMTTTLSVVALVVGAGVLLVSAFELARSNASRRLGWQQPAYTPCAVVPRHYWSLFFVGITVWAVGFFSFRGSLGWWYVVLILVGLYITTVIPGAIHIRRTGSRP